MNMGISWGQALMNTCDNHATKTSNEAVDQQSGERRPALHAEGNIAKKEKEEATYMR